MEGGAYQFQNSAADAGLGMMFWLIALGVYLFVAYLQFRIAQKAGCENNAWMAFIPLFNVYLLTQTASKPGWWFFLMLIPIAGVFVMAYLWAETAKNIGQNPVWGWLWLLPLVNFVSLIVMAFSSGSAPSSLPSQPTQPRQPAGVA